ncbi:hypothetical protein D1AOALGA4SA_10899 [Olavius algarvensis Delta 1 endosymbiont]|nr:hypothetical protein D1AOALGA4SA_10899 [Olavius algarvensis Delta 1 endosymbiont]
MEIDKFCKLKIDDKILLNPFAEGFPWTTFPEDHWPCAIVAKVITGPDLKSNSPEVTVQLEPYGERAFLGGANKEPFCVKSWQVLRALTADECNLPAQDQPRIAVDALTEQDKEVFAQGPSVFIAKQCRYRWLPQHGEMFSARDQNKSKNISDKGGMLALLQYRSFVSESLVALVGVLTKKYSTGVRRKQVAALVDSEMSPVDKMEYIAAVKPLVGNAPGSTQPTSDIDINTQGDGTEFAVCMFNSIFRQMHGGNEPGIVFDVNIYGKDFLPSFGGWPTRTKGEAANFIRPYFDHEFTDYHTEQKDAEIQIENAFVKLRRYSPKDMWEKFKQHCPKEFYSTLEEARKTHLKYAFWIAQAYNKKVAPKDVKEPDRKILLSGEEFLADKRIDPAELMATQNRFYEHFLMTEVEPRRDTFNLLKARQKLTASAPVGRHVGDLNTHTHGQAHKANALAKDEAEAEVDNAYLALRQAMSESLYFANEAYVTAGAVLQTVGGKQIKSKGVTSKRSGRPPQHIIAYTAHELMACIVDQLADIHKEAGRHFAEEGNENDVGGTLLACGKYIHRLLNAVKHLYLLFALAGLPNAKDGVPHNLFSKSPTEWVKFRKLGFGLEALKKRDFESDRQEITKVNKNPKNPEDSESLRELLVNKFSRDVINLEGENGDISFIENKENNKSGLAERLATIETSGLSYELNNQKIIIKKSDASSFYTFFDQFVAQILSDYLLYKSLNAGDLKSNFGDLPFTLARKVLTADGTEEEKKSPKQMERLVEDHADEMAVEDNELTEDEEQNWEENPVVGLIPKRPPRRR